MLRSQTVAVAMSGGVDSAVAALLLKDAGYDVHGIFMRTWNSSEDERPIADCPWRTDMNDARNVCEHLGISFEVINMISNYRELVVKELVEGYRIGITPNPDVLCNMRIKFGALRRYATEQGYTYFATGHYCRSQQLPNGRTALLEGCDKNKDQSYFLAMLEQEQVQNVLFPIGHLTKPEVRKIAEQRQLPNAKKKDSQGICFLGKVRIQDFLSHYIDSVPGDIVDTAGTVLGRHNGLFRFTIGQRHGINIPSNRDFQHYVVIGKDLDRNQLIVEIETDQSPHLYQSEFSIKAMRFVDMPLPDYATLLARPRYRDPACPITFQRTANNTAHVTFQVPQRAVASGQILAFYSGETLIGGGIFQ